MKFAPSIFTNGVEVLKSNTEGTQAFLRELEQQMQTQKELFQKLMQTSMEASKNLFHTPL